MQYPDIMVSCDGSSGESSKTVAESTIPIKSAVDIESPLESGFQTGEVIFQNVHIAIFHQEQ